jgi:bacterial/archaeal transporter family-2 protein
MTKFIWITLAFVSGAFLPLQAALNTKLGKTVGSPLHASLISFLIGSAGLALYILLTRQPASFTALKSAPLYVWIGGLLGACYVTAIILLFPRLGPGLTFGLVVAGQMTLAAFLEHFNILVSQPHPISFIRIVGILLIIVGVVLVRYF